MQQRPFLKGECGELNLFFMLTLFNLDPLHPLFNSLCQALNAEAGILTQRQFPDGESYLRIEQDVAQQDIFILATLDRPNEKFLPLIFLADTLKELGAKSVSLIAPYLSYMRQDCRFHSGEAITSRSFAQSLSQHIDGLITVDPHLHRYHNLNEIYSVPAIAVSAEAVLAKQLTSYEKNTVLVGPDAESAQWLQRLSEYSGLPYVVGEKQRLGDRSVEIVLPDMSAYQNYTAVMMDDVVSSGQTLLQCLAELRKQGIQTVDCLAVHGIFVDHVDEQLKQQGLRHLITTNSIGHSSNSVDLTSVLKEAVMELQELMYGRLA